MVKIVRFNEMGGPQVLVLDEVDVPAPGPGEVRIAVEAIGLNRVEAMFRSGGFIQPALPARLGYEAAGRIDAVGSAVTHYAVGDRVAVLPGLSMEQYGTYGELILYPADMLVDIPDTQDFIDAAATWMQYLTAYGLIACGRIQPGDHVVITAASSSVGLAAIQVALGAGAIPIAVTRGRSKVEGLRRHGAAHVIVSDEQDVAQAIMACTSGHGAAVAFDAVGGQPLANLLSAMAPKGLVILYGSLAGISVNLPLHAIMLNALSLRGFAANELLADHELRRNAIQYIYDGLASGKLRPVIDRTFRLEDIVDAHRYLESNAQLGKIVVTVGR